ncbi:hypothetical protein [Dyella silvatica]|uniref:hypothetical protein n=1 Tax=Dyella silvatica TaxID=2992128 RepID=UPI0022536B3B|nr:hypothetical protein [Dyella silvatica]
MSSTHLMASTATPRRRRFWRDLLTVRGLFTGASMLLLFLSVVIPNSLQVPTAGMLAICFLLSLHGFKLVPGLKTVLLFYTGSAMVTLIYIAVGYLNDAPWIAAAQVTAIYIVSPLLWTFIAASLSQRVGTERLIHWLIWLALLCCVSVAIYFALYRIGGAAAVSFFTESANVNTSDGYSAAVMHVYGSLIFLCGGFFSSPELIQNKLLRMLLLASLLICIITSGRSALILSVPIGLLLGALLTPRTIGYKRRRSIFVTAIYGLPMLLAAIAAVFALSELGNIHLSVIFGNFIDKLSSGGGSARSGQAYALYDGILDSGGVGVGHGIGVSYIRSTDYPWRYELVWLATVLRVGIVGAIIYTSLFFWYAVKVTKLAMRRRLTPGMKFMFCGFMAAFVASNTNPYIEAFTFQWMYVIPVVGFFVDYSAARMAAWAPARACAACNTCHCWPNMASMWKFVSCSRTPICRPDMVATCFQRENICGNITGGV